MTLRKTQNVHLHPHTGQIQRFLCHMSTHNNITNCVSSDASSHTHTHTHTHPLHFADAVMYRVHPTLLDDGEHWCGHREWLTGAPTDWEDGVQSTEREVVLAGTAEDALWSLHGNRRRGGGHLLWTSVRALVVVCFSWGTWRVVLSWISCTQCGEASMVWGLWWMEQRLWWGANLCDQVVVRSEFMWAGCGEEWVLVSRLWWGVSSCEQVVVRSEFVFYRLWGRAHHHNQLTQTHSSQHTSWHLTTTCSHEDRGLVYEDCGGQHMGWYKKAPE